MHGYTPTCNDFYYYILLYIIVAKGRVSCLFGWSIKAMKGFSKVEKKKMLLSPETLLGLKMTGS